MTAVGHVWTAPWQRPRLQSWCSGPPPSWSKATDRPPPSWRASRRPQRVANALESVWRPRGVALTSYGGHLHQLFEGGPRSGPQALGVSRGRGLDHLVGHEPQRVTQTRVRHV